MLTTTLYRLIYVLLDISRREVVTNVDVLFENVLPSGCFAKVNHAFIVALDRDIESNSKEEVKFTHHAHLELVMHDFGNSSHVS
ncbi:hypothetical protein Tco_0667323 [Tanacetum coccineum]